MSDLKPCPFCGSDAYIDIYCCKDGTWDCEVACTYCGAHFVLDDIDTRKEAIAMQAEAWNRRVGDE